MFGTIYRNRKNAAIKQQQTKLQLLLKEQLVDLSSCRCSAELPVIGVGGESPQHCHCVQNDTVTHLSDLDIDIEESDEQRFVHHELRHEWISSDCVAVVIHGCVLYQVSSFGKGSTHRCTYL